MSVRHSSVAALCAVGLSALPALAQVIDPPPSPPPSLKSVKVPKVPNLEAYVRNRQAAIVLGKALFWDQQVGSDGLACASCHFHAGADNRTRNQLSPSLLHRDPARANTFEPTRTGGGGPDYALQAADFPLHVLADPDDRESTVLFDSDDVVSSSGVFHSRFVNGGTPASMFDVGTPVTDPLFTVFGANARRVEPRNTPTMINAVFNFRNFWDGRANNVFNGVDPFGPRSPGRVLAWDGRRLRERPVRLANSSLASQAVGPPLSDFEMSCAGRTFPDLGRKLLPRTPLAFQLVAPDDSVLGSMTTPGGYGLATTYQNLVQLAFVPEWWSAPASQTTTAGFTQVEHNFSLFWGLAIQLYETTLVSDDAPYDRFADGDANALSEAQRRGLDVFLHKGGCINCHKGPDFTGAGITLQKDAQEGGLIERMLLGAGQVGLYDNGFYNIGVRPTVEDVGVGGTDPWGNPLSFTRQWQNWLNGGRAPVDSFRVVPSTFEVQMPLPLAPTRADLRTAFGSDQAAVDGSFKTPGLRNVELTGPYFHNGGQATLEQVVAFYNRGGDRRSTANGDTSGFGANASNLDPDIEPRHLTPQDQADLVDFLKSLTDERVRWERAPFDHPQLSVPHGHAPGGHAQLGPQLAADDGFVLPPVGRGGRAAIGLPPLQPFHTRLP